MSILSYIVWSPNPDIFELGPLTIRWYGVLFALGFIIGQQIIYYIYKTEGKPEKDVEALTIYMVIATIIGARLGHVLFYQPGEYLSNPINILKIWEGGLASHGAAIGIILGIYIFSNYYVNISFKEFKWKKQKREGQSFFWVIDKIVIVVALAGCLIRLGNFLNSEIIGTETGSNAGVVFAWDAERTMKRKPVIEDAVFFKPNADTIPESGSAPMIMELKFVRGNFVSEQGIRNFIEQQVPMSLNNDPYASQHIMVPDDLNYQLFQRRGHFVAHVLVGGIPRHPAQLYEAISSLILFILLFLYWRKKYHVIPDGRIFGIFLVVLFSLRFVYEFVKMPQVEFEEQMVLNMGQWLSIPMVIAGIVVLVLTNKKTVATEKL
jgi:phosphatidylglycerol---prolipoprotein diacylglyceryl transferase